MKPWKRFILLLICFVFYLCLGAILFNILEEGIQKKITAEAKDFHDDFLREYPCVTTEKFVQIARNSYDYWQDNINWELVNDTNPVSHKWSWANSLFFSATVITTIGYGHQSPTSLLSRVVFIPYALIGIPLTGLLLGAIGSMLEGVWKTLAHRLFDAMGCIRLPTHRKIACLLVMVIAAYTLIIVLPALIFRFTEEWTWFEAQYFTFCSLSTVGFGDFVAGYKPYEDNVYLTVYKICTIIYIVLGLSVLAILFRVVQEYQEKQVGKMKNLTRSVTSKVIRSQRQSDFQSSVEKVGKNKDDEDNGICLRKATFLSTDISSDMYHTNEDGLSITVDRGMQTDAETLGILQEYHSLLKYGDAPTQSNSDSSHKYHVAIIENGHCDIPP